MYSFEARGKAVELYIKYGLMPSKVIHELGYPDRHTLEDWYKEYQETGELRKCKKRQDGHLYSLTYTDGQVKTAVDHYISHGKSYRFTQRELGYPHNYHTLEGWIRKLAPKELKPVVNHSTQIRYPNADAQGAFATYFAEPGKAVGKIAEEHGLSRLDVYYYRHKLEKTGYNLPEMRIYGKKWISSISGLITPNRRYCIMTIKRLKRW